MEEINDYNIRKTLECLYSNHEAAHLVVIDACRHQPSVKEPAFGNDVALNVYWNRLWEYVRAQEREKILFKYILKDYPGNSEIRRYYDHYATVVLEPGQATLGDVPSTTTGRLGGSSPDQPRQGIEDTDILVVKSIQDTSVLASIADPDSANHRNPDAQQAPGILRLLRNCVRRWRLRIQNMYIFLNILLVAVVLCLLSNIFEPAILIAHFRRVEPTPVFIVPFIVLMVLLLVIGMIPYDLSSIFRKISLRIAFAKRLYSSLSALKPFWYRVINIAAPLILILLIPPFYLWRSNTIDTGVGPLPGNAGFGVCDGACIVDSNRLSGTIKMEAASAFQRQQNDLGCEYLRFAALGDISGPETGDNSSKGHRAQGEDTTDAEAKIDYADRCSGLRCPCMSLVVVVELLDPCTQNADFINGMSRSILQGAYLRQMQWNTSHSQGPGMYLFIANVEPGSLDASGSASIQQQVANQILRIRRNDQEHIIIGAIGLPPDTDNLVHSLSNAHIPMVSTAALTPDEARQPYLTSVAPSLQDEVNEVEKFYTDRRSENPNYTVEYYYDSSDAYSSTFTNLLPNNLFSTYSLSYGYGDLQRVASQVAYSSSNLIIFIGTTQDTTTFLIQLREKEKQDNKPSHAVLTSDNFYQWVYNYFDPQDRQAFDNVYFVAFAYPDFTWVTPHPNNPGMLTDFTSTFDPKGEHSGNVYTYRRAGSDAILAYDTLSLVINAQEHIDCNSSCDAAAWENELQNYITKPHNSFNATTGQISFLPGSSIPSHKILFILSIHNEDNGNPQVISGNY